MGESLAKRQRRFAKQNKKNSVKMHPGYGFRWKRLFAVMVIVVIAVLVLPHLW